MWRILLILLAFFTTTLSGSDAGSKPMAPIEEEAMPPVESYGYTFFKMIVTLVVLVGLVIVTLWLLRRLSGGRLRGQNQMRAIKILERRPLSPKSMLYLVEVEGKQVLISESQLEVSFITELNEIDKPS